MAAFVYLSKLTFVPAKSGNAYPSGTVTISFTASGTSYHAGNANYNTSTSGTITFTKNAVSGVNAGITSPADSTNGYVFALYNAGIVGGQFADGKNYYYGSEYITRTETAPA